MPTLLNVEADYLWEGWFQSGTCFLTLLGLHFILVVKQRWICWCPHVPVNVSFITPLESPLPVGALGLNAFNHPWTCEMSYAFSLPALVPQVLFTFLADYVTVQFRLLILVAPCWMEAPWLCSWHVGRHSLLVFYHKIPCHGCFSSLGAQWSAVTTLNLWLLGDICSTEKGSLPQSVRQWWKWLKYLQQKLTSNAGKNWLVSVLDRVWKECFFCA